jgi:hypothetical protein
VPSGAGYTHAKLADTEHDFVAGQRLPGLPNAAYNRIATNQPRSIGVDLDYRY